MPIERVNDVRAFRQFIDEQLSNGASELTLDETLAQLGPGKYYRRRASRFNSSGERSPR